MLNQRKVVELKQNYVDNLSSLTQDGTRQNPWITIQKGFDVAEPTDTLELRTMWAGPIVAANWINFINAHGGESELRGKKNAKTHHYTFDS
jgi:hypothetical protein